jgi:hypothetical protein
LVQVQYLKSKFQIATTICTVVSQDHNFFSLFQNITTFVVHVLLTAGTRPQKL